MSGALSPYRVLFILMGHSTKGFTQVEKSKVILIEDFFLKRLQRVCELLTILCQLTRPLLTLANGLFGVSNASSTSFISPSVLDLPPLPNPMAVL